MSHTDVIVVGAGAAGMTAAIFAAETGARVLLLERTEQAGKKILMSGGTRCNVLPVQMELSDYETSSSKNLLKRIFKSWSLDHCKQWFERELGLKLACEVESNKWFPVSNSAREVRDLLLKKVLSSGVQVKYKSAVSSISRKNEQWTLTTDAGDEYSASQLIVATGGLSVPSIGTDGMGHRFLKKIGHPMVAVYPALTPLTGSHPGSDNLAGISLHVNLSVFETGIEPVARVTSDDEYSTKSKGGHEASVRSQSTQAGSSTKHPNQKLWATSNREGFLFTHKGFSGPSILDLSHFATRYLLGLGNRPEYRVNWTGEPAGIWKTRLEEGGITVQALLRNHLPNRLAEALCEMMPFAARRTAELNKGERQRLMELLTEYPLHWSSNEGYRKAEVTGGGVPLEDIHTATLESKHQPGLYLCGEILDVFGRIGGFNFYWAWVTGRLAGKSITPRAQQLVQEA